MHLLGGHSEGVTILAMAGRSRENCCNMVEVVFKLRSKRLVVDGCRLVGSRLMLGRKPFLAYLMAEVMVIIKSGATRRLG